MLKYIEKKLFKQPKKSWAGGHCFIKRWRFLGANFIFQWQDSNGLGRFGGGWNWEFGFRASRSTIIFNLLFCSLRVDREISL